MSAVIMPKRLCLVAMNIWVQICRSSRIFLDQNCSTLEWLIAEYASTVVTRKVPIATQSLVGFFQGLRSSQAEWCSVLRKAN